MVDYCKTVHNILKQRAKEDIVPRCYANIYNTTFLSAAAVVCLTHQSNCI